MTHGLGEDKSRGRVMPDPVTQPCFCQPIDHFSGLWHGQTRIDSPYGWKYSGGLCTYPAQQRPQAVYAPEAEKTFFCWGAADPENYLAFGERSWDFGGGSLFHAMAFFDHRASVFSQPIVVFDKWCADPHDNPVLQIDAAGHLWLFSPSHGDWTTRSFIHRSAKPYAIDRWETVSDGPLFAYPQPHYHPDHGFILLHTRYADGRGLHVKRSPDGYAWSEPSCLAQAGQGHYQVTWYDKAHHRLMTAFDYHPVEGGLDARTNLYFMSSEDWGESWQDAAGNTLTLPITSPEHAARVCDFESQGLVCFIKDLVTDRHGQPIVLYSTSHGWEPGPEHGPHRWWLARHDHQGWHHHAITDSDNNYDFGSLYLEQDDQGQERLRLIGATETGPQPFNPGGEIAVWLSHDGGTTWAKQHQLTHDSRFNHTYPRRPLDAHPDFYAFWADGHGTQPSPSRLWYAGRDDHQAQPIATPKAPHG